MTAAVPFCRVQQIRPRWRPPLPTGHEGGLFLAGGFLPSSPIRNGAFYPFMYPSERCSPGGPGSAEQGASTQKNVNAWTLKDHSVRSSRNGRTSRLNEIPFRPWA